ncbi:capsular polysaccharide export protein, LipB/KpsS family [Aquimarina intermedia]|uniref:Capsular polysaccharide biosynthesis protein n=1 Tax=Aquimarina intermedia TaxID=350814 RepID=A0A5S5CED9_9FLAO|nr:hypothetical protein [Aquimarina intermedia]TYP76872.1 capsular polysaccharide biosynthesis protein [Aquimarina intermedia]
MKILIIESRSNIVLWDEVFQNNLDDTVEVHYLIFNAHFSSNFGINHYVKKNKDEGDNIDVPIQFDRQRNFFKSTNVHHYGSYYRQIYEIINKIQPNVVLGEAASFQDYLTIKVCREFGILYLNPMTSRYPSNRFAFYIEDTLVPFLGSRENLNENNLTKIYEGIVNRVVIPDYMSKKNYKFSIVKRILDLKVKLLSYLKGDPNTPSALYFISRTISLKKIEKQWSNVSVNDLTSENKFKLLYPMQMQPESNIDVYGAPFNNQFEIIKSICKYLDKDDVLYIKPNPKPFMEISEELVRFANQSKQIKLLSFDSSMNDIFPKVDLIITVTGTVSIEAILANKPVGVFKTTYFNDTKNCYQIKNYEDIADLIGMVKTKSFTKLNIEDRLDHLNYLNNISYQGRISFVNLQEDEILEIRKSFKLFLSQFSLIDPKEIEKHISTIN